MTPATITTIAALALAIAAMLYAMHWRAVADELQTQLTDANELITDLILGDE